MREGGPFLCGEGWWPRPLSSGSLDLCLCHLNSGGTSDCSELPHDQACRAHGQDSTVSPGFVAVLVEKLSHCVSPLSLGAVQHKKRPSLPTPTPASSFPDTETMKVCVPGWAAKGTAAHIPVPPHTLTATSQFTSSSASSSLSALSHHHVVPQPHAHIVWNL